MHDVRPWTWADQQGGTKAKGVKITRGRVFLFIPDTEVLDLANELADHLANRTNSN